MVIVRLQIRVRKNGWHLYRVRVRISVRAYVSGE
jgi:hypothetical protein